MRCMAESLSHSHTLFCSLLRAYPPPPPSYFLIILTTCAMRYGSYEIGLPSNRLQISTHCIICTRTRMHVLTTHTHACTHTHTCTHIHTRMHTHITKRLNVPYYMHMHQNTKHTYHIPHNTPTHSRLIGLVWEGVRLVRYIGTTRWVLQHDVADLTNTESEGIWTARHSHSPLSGVRECLPSNLLGGNERKVLLNRPIVVKGCQVQTCI